MKTEDGSPKTEDGYRSGWHPWQSRRVFWQKTAFCSLVVEIRINRRDAIPWTQNSGHELKSYQEEAQITPGTNRSRTRRKPKYSGHEPKSYPEEAQITPGTNLSRTRRKTQITPGTNRSR